MITPTQHTNILPPQIQQILELLLKFLFKRSWSGMDLCNLSRHPRYVDEQEIKEFQAY